MSELGRTLSEARTARELSLADVEAGTRIRQKYLEALEGGRYSDLPRGATARGFLRTYARYLGLDEEAMLQLYTQESGDEEAELPIAEPGKPRLIDYRPLEVELMDIDRPVPWWRWVVALVIVGVLAAIAWWYLTVNSRGTPLALFQPSPTATATQTATRWVVVVTVTPEPSATPQMLPSSDLLSLPTPTVPPTITPTPRPTATPEIVARLALDLETTQRAWVRVVADGAVAEEGVLEPGQTRSWQADNSILVRTGNGGGILLALNGEDLGPMGEVGQIVERSWIVEEGGVAEATPGVEAPTPTATGTPTPAG